MRDATNSAYVDWPLSDMGIIRSTAAGLGQALCAPGLPQNCTAAFAAGLRVRSAVLPSLPST